MATSVPVAMAKLTSAAANAGASLMPSPTMATVALADCPAASDFNEAIVWALSCGSTSAITRVMPSDWAIAAAAPSLSPTST
jgi:hypothetical protein